MSSMCHCVAATIVRFVGAAMRPDGGGILALAQASLPAVVAGQHPLPGKSVSPDAPGTPA
jgi:hypothetical protein